uniref:Uncharacterized protein n=1 Tax=Oncorhynchus tshawytscha TaxID=74940 RepID=A0AAZ3QU62_ONCTS
MELQCLQEALKVEIQCHQVKTKHQLKKQLHERHDRITALSEKQVRKPPKLYYTLVLAIIIIHVTAIVLYCVRPLCSGQCACLKKKRFQK